MKPMDYELMLLARKHKVFLETIQPLLAIKRRVYDVKLPTIILYDDGRSEFNYTFTPEEQKLLDSVDEAVKACLPIP